MEEKKIKLDTINVAEKWLEQYLQRNPKANLVFERRDTWEGDVELQEHRIDLYTKNEDGSKGWLQILVSFRIIAYICNQII